jgi:hypothetical protein
MRTFLVARILYNADMNKVSRNAGFRFTKELENKTQNLS